MMMKFVQFRSFQSWVHRYADGSIKIWEIDRRHWNLRKTERTCCSVKCSGGMSGCRGPAKHCKNRTVVNPIWDGPCMSDIDKKERHIDEDSEHWIGFHRWPLLPIPYQWFQLVSTIYQVLLLQLRWYLHWPNFVEKFVNPPVSRNLFSVWLVKLPSGPFYREIWRKFQLNINNYFFMPLVNSNSIPLPPLLPTQLNIDDENRFVLKAFISIFFFVLF